MSRVQLALRVPDLPASIAFYSKLFGTEPAKLRDGYANFAIADPPLKLVLIQGGRGENPSDLRLSAPTGFCRAGRLVVRGFCASPRSGPWAGRTPGLLPGLRRSRCLCFTK